MSLEAEAQQNNVLLRVYSTAAAPTVNPFGSRVCWYFIVVQLEEEVTLLHVYETVINPFLAGTSHGVGEKW